MKPAGRKMREANREYLYARTKRRLRRVETWAMVLEEHFPGKPKGWRRPRPRNAP